MNVQYTQLSEERRKRFRSNCWSNKQNALRYFIAKLKKLSNDYLEYDCVEDFYAPVFEQIRKDAISVGCSAEYYCDGCNFWDENTEKCKALYIPCNDNLLVMGNCIHAVIRDMELELELEKKESAKRRQWRQMSRYNLWEWNILRDHAEPNSSILLDSFHKKEDGESYMLERANETETILQKNFGKDSVCRHTDASVPGILKISIWLKSQEYQRFTLKSRRVNG